MVLYNSLPDVLTEQIDKYYSPEEIASFELKHLRVAIGVHASILEIEGNVFDA